MAIIGTAGSKFSDRMNPELFRAMVTRAGVIVDGLECEHGEITLVSGGAAVSDHIAVVLWLQCQDFEGLHLYIPCGWDSDRNQFCDNGKQGWRDNPGRTANSYHGKFAQSVQEDTLYQIELGRLTGAVLDDSCFGFHARNSSVAQSDVVIAFTWSKTNSPDDGGTKSTWNKATNSRRIHVSLHELQDEIAAECLLGRAEQ